MFRLGVWPDFHDACCRLSEMSRTVCKAVIMPVVRVDLSRHLRSWMMAAEVGRGE